MVTVKIHKGKTSWTMTFRSEASCLWWCRKRYRLLDYWFGEDEGEVWVS